MDVVATYVHPYYLKYALLQEPLSEPMDHETTALIVEANDIAFCVVRNNIHNPFRKPDNDYIVYPKYEPYKWNGKYEGEEVIVAGFPSEKEKQSEDDGM